MKNLFINTHTILAKISLITRGIRSSKNKIFIFFFLELEKVLRRRPKIYM